MNSNPLLALDDLPRFAHIQAEHVQTAIDQVLADNRAELKRLLDQPGPPSWASLIHPLDLLEERLSRVWSPVRHLNSVHNSPALREAYNACLAKLTDYSTELGQNRQLFEAYQALAEGAEFATLDATQQKIITDALRDFRLSGVDLPEAQKQRYKAIAQQLSSLQSRFEENILDATQAWRLHLEEVSALAGLPPSALALLAQNAAQAELAGFVLNLEFPSYYAVMTYADDRQLREQVYTAYVTRASDQGPHDAALDNSALMDEILRLRHEQAQLLGYPHYAALSLATKMADNAEEVMRFLRDLAQASKPHAQQELAELQRFAREQLGIDSLAAWDISYASEKLRQQAYALSQEDLKPYFPVDRVLDGLFALLERLYQVRVVSKDGVETWHPEVRFYAIEDPDGTPRAYFYLDLYARAHKRGGAWMDVCQNRLRDGAQLQLPVAYMTCNGTPPVDGKPALFTHDEVITLFHEFGHGLHHMLTRIDYPAASGINGVEWDAVELPSQFMENWCWQRESLLRLSGHYETGQPLPEELFARLLRTHHFQAGLQMLRQIEFALFDMRIHAADPAVQGAEIQAMLDAVRAEIAVLKPPAFNRFQHSFSHIFAGGYAAGYYSYKWAEVLSADAFARFEEEGLFNARVGQDFLQKILERGGSQPALALFRDFRGRAPQISALLRHHGLGTPAENVASA